MINYEPVIARELFNDPTINEMTGGRVYAGNLPQEVAAEFPCILVIETDNIDTEYWGNKAVASDIDLQVNVWIKADDNIGPIQAAIDRKMKALRCRRVTSSSFDENEREAFRKALLYRTTVKLKEENIDG
ncbi:tail completion protein gp17 [Bacillus amyloliquefaciens]|uniref:tail completion protein gp17 n=1 Tax=Bacillus amyloliquefaciens TaxID=1390 RepID=UPI0011C79FA3|nr:DUF3168 domain-containing protein [Bacillus amyloliquefaciens]TXK24386.1 DUF3168 domain-containing protein [Bacillus amyloliquefaciens]TXK30602.1 DUF3168 domain-containing protein [Bacillus amyloliquefaciens]